MQVTIYSTGDIADHLGLPVSRVAGWVSRGLGPRPTFITPKKTRMWRSLDGWDEFYREWVQQRINDLRVNKAVR